MPIRLKGSTSGYSEIDAPAAAGDQLFPLPVKGGGLDTLNRAGNILQVVNATYSTQVSNTTSVFADTGLTATITPTASSSKILVTVNQAGCGKTTTATALRLALLRNGVLLTYFERFGGGTGASNESMLGSCSICLLDSPATTSAVTYKTQLQSAANSAAVCVQREDGGAASTSTITLLEVAA